MGRYEEFRALVRRARAEYELALDDADDAREHGLRDPHERVEDVGLDISSSRSSGRR